MDFILDNQELIIKQIGRIGWYTARVEKLFAQMKNKKAKAFSAAFRKALTGYEQELNKQVQETPYGVPYRRTSGVQAGICSVSASSTTS